MPLSSSSTSSTKSMRRAASELERSDSITVRNVCRVQVPLVHIFCCKRLITVGNFVTIRVISGAQEAVARAVVPGAHEIQNTNKQTKNYVIYVIAYITLFYRTKLPPFYFPSFWNSLQGSWEDGKAWSRTPAKREKPLPQLRRRQKPVNRSCLRKMTGRRFSTSSSP